MLIEIRVVDMNHAGLRESGQYLVGALGGIVGASFQCGGAESRVKAGKAIPSLVNDHFDAFGMGCLDNGRQIVAQAVISAIGQISACASSCVSMASNIVCLGTGP